MTGLFIDTAHYDWADEARAAARDDRQDARRDEYGGYDPANPPRPAVDHRGPERACQSCGHRFRPDADRRTARLCIWCATDTQPLTDPTKEPAR